MKRLLFLIAFIACVAHGQVSVAIQPTPRMQLLDVNGHPLAGGKLCVYAAGTTTPQATYTDSSGTLQNSNPIILDTGGFATVWVDISKSYKFVLLSAGTDNSCSTGQQQWTVDNVEGIEAIVQGIIATIGLAPAGVPGNTQSNNGMGGFDAVNVINIDGVAYSKTAAGINAADVANVGSPTTINISYPGSYCDTKILAPSLNHRLHFGVGVYLVNISASDSLNSLITWQIDGEGLNQTFLMACPNSNADVITTRNFSAGLTSSMNPYSTVPGYVLDQSGNNFGTYQVLIKDLTIDGNRSTMGGSIGTSDCIRLYGSSWTIMNVTVQSCHGDGLWLEFNGMRTETSTTTDTSGDQLINVASRFNDMNGMETEDDVDSVSGYRSFANGVNAVTNGWGWIDWGPVESVTHSNIFSGANVSPYGGALYMQQGGGISAGAANEFDGGCWGVLAEHLLAGPVNLQGEIGASRSCNQTAIGLELRVSLVHATGTINGAGIGVQIGCLTAEAGCSGGHASSYNNLFVNLQNNSTGIVFAADGGNNTIIGDMNFDTGAGEVAFGLTPPNAGDLLMLSQNGGGPSSYYEQIPNLSQVDASGNVGLNVTNAYTSVATAVNGNVINMNNNAGTDDAAGNLTGLRLLSSGTHRFGNAFACNTGPAVTTFNFENCLDLTNYHDTGISMQSLDTNATDIFITPPANDTGLALKEDNAAGNATVYKLDHQGFEYPSQINQLAANRFAGICTLGTSCTITFFTGFNSTPSCIATDQTNADAVKAVPTTAGVTITGNGTDVISWACFGNPN